MAKLALNIYIYSKIPHILLPRYAELQDQIEPMIKNDYCVVPPGRTVYITTDNLDTGTLASNCEPICQIRHSVTVLYSICHAERDIKEPNRGMKSIL